MKASAALALATVVLSVAGQAQNDNNLVDRNNHSYLVVSSTKHTVTGKNYLWAPNCPLEFSPASIGGTGTGVPAGTLTFRHLVGLSNRRSEARQFSGFQLGVAPTVSTTTFPMTGYVPEFTIRPSVARTPAPGGNPDMTKPELIKVAKASQNFTALGYYIVTSTLATPVAFTGDDFCLCVKWEGTEMQDTPGGVGFFGDYSAGALLGSTVFGITHGFTTPANVSSPTSTDFSVLWCNYMEEQASISCFSDWGYARNAAYPVLNGNNIHTINSDIGTVAGTFGYDLAAGLSNSGGYGILLLNVGPVFPTSFNLLGQVLELNIADPALGALAGALGAVQLDPQGKAAGAKLPVPPLGAAASGQHIGVEAAILPASLTQISETTQATWFRIK